MLRIDQIRLLPGDSEALLPGKCARILRLPAEDIVSCAVLRRAIDAREGLTLVYTAAVEVKREDTVLRRCRDKRVSRYAPETYALPAAVTAAATINAASEPCLSISKALTPASVPQNGQLTYTFLIENYGNEAAEETDAAIVADVFNPILQNLSVTFNGTAWTAGTDYTYDATTGRFATVAGKVTVPAATYTQDAATGVWTTAPGSSTLTVTGTL